MAKSVKSSEHTATTHPSPIENWAFPDDDGAPEKLKFLFPAAAAADVGTLQATWSTELQGVKWQFNTMSLGFNSNWNLNTTSTTFKMNRV